MAAVSKKREPYALRIYMKNYPITVFDGEWAAKKTYNSEE